MVFAAVMLAASTLQANTVTCPGTLSTGDREFTVSISVGSGTASCYDTGTGNIIGTDTDFTGYSYIDKDNEASESDGGMWWTKYVGTNSSGQFFLSSALWSTYSSLLIVFKSGVGQLDPDWAAFRLTRVVTEGGWLIDPSVAGGLSHVIIYGQRAVVPEPASMLLFGTGMIGVAHAARKRWRTRRA